MPLLDEGTKPPNLDFKLELEGVEISQGFRQLFRRFINENNRREGGSEDRGEIGEQLDLFRYKCRS